MFCQHHEGKNNQTPKAFVHPSVNGHTPELHSSTDITTAAHARPTSKMSQVGQALCMREQNSFDIRPPVTKGLNMFISPNYSARRTNFGVEPIQCYNSILQFEDQHYRSDDRGKLATHLSFHSEAKHRQCYYSHVRNRVIARTTSITSWREGERGSGYLNLEVINAEFIMLWIYVIRWNELWLSKNNFIDATSLTE